MPTRRGTSSRGRTYRGTNLRGQIEYNTGVNRQRTGTAARMAETIRNDTVDALNERERAAGTGTRYFRVRQQLANGRMGRGDIARSIINTNGRRSWVY